MSVEELEALARKHWTEWLPEKVKELRAEDQFTEAVHGAALLAQAEIEHLMKYQAYSISEAREVALPLFIFLPPEDPLGDMSPELREELAEMEREYRRNPPPEVRMYESSEEDMEVFDRTMQPSRHLPHKRQAALPTSSEEDEISATGIERGLDKVLKRKTASLDEE